MIQDHLNKDVNINNNKHSNNNHTNITAYTLAMRVRWTHAISRRLSHRTVAVMHRSAALRALRAALPEA